MNTLIIKNIDIRDVRFGENVTIIQPVNLYDCQIGNHTFIGPFVEIQKEALWHGKQCFTLRNETEWTETINQRVNTMVKEEDKINLSENKMSDFTNPYEFGESSINIVNILNQGK